MDLTWSTGSVTEGSSVMSDAPGVIDDGELLRSPVRFAKVSVF